jgi:hypothetical protein
VQCERCGQQDDGARRGGAQGAPADAPPAGDVLHEAQDRLSALLAGG